MAMRTKNSLPSASVSRGMECYPSSFDEERESAYSKYATIENGSNLVKLLDNEIRPQSLGDNKSDDKSIQSR
jgi:hypothetical protein